MMKKNIKNKVHIINNFPFIIMVVAAVVIVFLVNVYLKFRPHDTIYQTGYMVLADNMAYNLINNNTISDDLNVGVVSVNNGDSIYKQIDSFYVGEIEKKEIDYGYPIYSPDGLTIYAVNDKFTIAYKKVGVLFMARNDFEDAIEYFEDYIKFDIPQEEKDSVNKLIERIRAKVVN